MGNRSSPIRRVLCGTCGSAYPRAAMHVGAVITCPICCDTLEITRRVHGVRPSARTPAVCDALPVTDLRKDLFLVVVIVLLAVGVFAAASTLAGRPGRAETDRLFVLSRDEAGWLSPSSDGNGATWARGVPGAFGDDPQGRER